MERLGLGMELEDLTEKERAKAGKGEDMGRQ